MFVYVHQGNLGPISTRVHKAEQYFNQTDTDCAINSCPELLRKGKRCITKTKKPCSSHLIACTNKILCVCVRSGAIVPHGAQHLHHSCNSHAEQQPVRGGRAGQRSAATQSECRHVSMESMGMWEA